MPKKIISYAFWGREPLYAEGAVRNARHDPEVLPDYTCRFYIDDTVTDEARKAIESTGAEIYVMSRSVDVLGMFWRFRPMYTENADIERFIVRDTDCVITADREVPAIREWESSGKSFHIIRDNRVHNIPILGGTWGAVPWCVDNFEIAMQAFLSRVQPTVSQHTKRLYHGCDQQFLCWYVWPRVLNSHLAHVRAGERGLLFTGEEKELPPLEDGGHFVGEPR